MSFAIRILRLGALAGSAVVCLFAQSGTVDSDPPRFRWDLELRGRFEAPSGIDFDGARVGRLYFGRIRFSAAAEAARWFRLYAQAQDARAFGFRTADSLDAVAHRLDIHQAYAEFGNPHGHWSARIGRQELAFGDERLIGADSFWDPLGFTFDAARATFKRANFQVDAFGAFVVVPDYERMARPSIGNRLYGIYASLRLPGGAVLEPYCIRNQRTPAGGLADVYTYGARAAGNLPRRFDYNVEMAGQRGNRLREPIRAWAGHWEMGYRIVPSDRSPRLSLESNYATGDGKPGDGHHSTFDDLYPAGYNKYGMADPFAWRNIKNIAGGVESSLTKRWRVAAGYRAFWLADVHDALYTKGEEFLVWNVHSPDTHVGNQANVSMTYDFSRRMQAAAGYARFYPGKYLLNSSLCARYSTPYVSWSYRF